MNRLDDDKDLNKETAELLTALIFGYGEHIHTITNQDQLMRAHGYFNSARNLLEALQRGRVVMTKTEKWND
jgi:hypothetical protein